jgi:hypothetical protein
VVIENQLERSDHDHLGKLLTYLAAFDAKVAVWIVSEPRPEHVQAISWLNQSELADFFLLKVEAIVIGDSDPAPLITKIVGPSLETTTVGVTKKEFADRQEVRFRFWEGFINAAKSIRSHYANRTPTHDNWLDKSDGVLTWVLVIKEHEAQAQFYVQNFKAAGNQALVSHLETDRAAIELSFGSPLVWDVVEGRKHAKVWAKVASSGYRDEHEWPQVYSAMFDGMDRLQSTLRPFLPEAIRLAALADKAHPDPAE